MPRMAVIILTVLIMSAMSASCSLTGIGDPRPIEDKGDVIIPPESSLIPGRNTNQRNIGAAGNLYQVNTVNSLYDSIDAEKIADFDADENYVYVLERAGSASNGLVSGDKISVYGTEDSGPVGQISAESRVGWTSIAALDGRVYTYDFTSGNISVFSSDGSFINEIKSRLPHLNISKMEIGDGGIILKAETGDTEKTGIFVVNADNGDSSAIGINDLIGKLGYDDEERASGPYIQDFCINGDRGIFIRVFPERLCLFSLDSLSVEKVSYMPDSARLIEFDSGMMYYVSGFKMGLFSNNVTNLSNEGSQGVVGRLLVNDRFGWSSDPASLAPFQLGDIIIPYDETNYQHVKMRQNNKYIFLLDSGTNTLGEAENRLARIAK